jgi:hypothetical protein
MSPARPSRRRSDGLAPELNVRAVGASLVHRLCEPARPRLCAVVLGDRTRNSVAPLSAACTCGEEGI